MSSNYDASSSSSSSTSAYDDTSISHASDGPTLHSKYLPELSTKATTEEACSQGSKTTKTCELNGSDLSTKQHDNASSTSTTSNAATNAYALHSVSFQPLPTSLPTKSRKN